MPPKNLNEALTVVISVVGFIGTTIALVYRYIRKIDQLESDARELRDELSELKGTVRAHGDALGAISAQLAGIAGRLDMLIERRDR